MSNPVAKLYAKALFELAREKNELEQVQKDFLALRDLFREAPALKQALSNQTFQPESKEKLVNELAQQSQMHPLLSRFLALLTAKGRVPLVEAAYESFRAFVDESNNVIRGTVTTVEQLTDVEAADLAKTFSRKFNKQVVLEPALDKEILGGLIVKIQGLTFDGSLKTTIRRLKENLERQSV